MIKKISFPISYLMGIHISIQFFIMQILKTSMIFFHFWQWNSTWHTSRRRKEHYLLSVCRMSKVVWYTTHTETDTWNHRHILAYRIDWNFNNLPDRRLTAERGRPQTMVGLPFWVLVVGWCFLKEYTKISAWQKHFFFVFPINKNFSLSSSRRYF